MSEKWFMLRQGIQYGPYTWEQLISLRREGNLLEEDLLWNSALENWLPAIQLSGLGEPQGTTGNIPEEIEHTEASSEKEVLDEKAYGKTGENTSEAPLQENVENTENTKAKFINEELTEKPTTPPRALRSFLNIYFKNLINVLRNLSRYQLILMGLVFLVIFLFNLYLVVFVNDGFSVRRDRWYNPIMAVEGTKVSVIFFWLTMITLFQSLAYRVKYFGLSRLIKDLIYTPSWLIKSASDAGETWALPLLLWTSLSLLVSLFIENPFTLLILALLAFFAFNSQNKGSLFYIIYLASLDWNYYFRKNKYLNLAVISLTLFGIFLGLLTSYFLPFKPLSIYIAAAVLLISAILLKIKSISSAGATGSAAGFLVFFILFTQTGVVWAHDGGFQEGGGTLGDWLRSAGAWTASTLGFESGLAGGLWSMFSSAFGRAGVDAGLLAGNVPGPAPTPVGPGIIDLGLTFGQIARADTPREANLAAAEALSNAWVPGMNSYMGGLTGEFTTFAGNFGGSSSSSNDTGSSESGGDSGGSGGSSYGGRRGTRGRRGYPYEPPADD